LAGHGTFAVASMNLHCGFSGTGKPFDVASVVRSLGAAVIALQETWTAESETVDPAADPVAAAARDLGASLMRVPLRAVPDLACLGLPGGSGPGQMGMALLTTLPVTGYEVISLGAAPADSIPRTAQLAWLTVGKQTVLRFVHTHLTYRPFSPVQLWRLRRALSGYAGPTIIAGDLNMPLPVASLTSGYRPAVIGRTWPADRPFLQLDHVLADSGIEPITGAVLPHAGSDHLAVRAEFRLPAARRGSRSDQAATTNRAAH
jgi:endonuclease/exonuclease/phosphatase family metal-dependent hydrolase